LQDSYNPADASDTSDANNAEVNIPMDATNDTEASDSVDGDAANIADAQAYQMLLQGDIHSTTTDAYDNAAGRVLDDEGPAEQSIEIDSSFTDASSVVVDAFPFGNPGAPIPGMPQDRSSYRPFQATQGHIWAPFQSERDWDFVHWAKTHGLTSSTIADFLAIRNVCVVHSYIPVCL
jgi:hypothetical protein